MSAVVVFDSPRIRALLSADLDRLAAIETQAYVRGWSRGIFADCLRCGYLCRGLQYGDLLAGYVIVSVAAAESHLLNLAVDPAWQRRGFGGLLLAHAAQLARTAGAECMFLEVRPSNEAARELYAQAGFTPFGRRCNYYPDSSSHQPEDALVLCRRLL